MSNWVLQPVPGWVIAQAVTNQIIAALSEDCRAVLAPRLMTKPIRAGEVLYVAGSPARSLIFPHDGMISLQTRLSDGRMIEQGQVCRDSMAGSEALLGVERAPAHAVVVLSGEASWLPVADLMEARQRFPSLDRAIQAHLARTMARTAQAVVCASVHTASQRIAGWLLRADDMILTDSLQLMQRSLAELLGLRLATVSEACSRLMRAGAIRYSRGSLTIIDRALLVSQACECYEANLAVTR